MILGDLDTTPEQADEDASMLKRPRAETADAASAPLLVSPPPRQALMNHPPESDLYPSLSKTMHPNTLPSRPLPPPVMTPADQRFHDRRLSAIELAVSRQNDRQQSLETTAQNLVVALSTAIQRLETGQGMQQQTLRTHENVMESQQALHTRAEAGLSQSNNQNQNSQAQIDALMHRYAAAEQEWKTRSLNHELETLQLQQKLQMLTTRIDSPAAVSPSVVKLSDVIPESHGTAVPPINEPFFESTPRASTFPSQNSTLFPPPRPATFPEQNPTPAPALAPSMFLAPPTIDSCPVFTPSTYQHWEREVRLWMAGFPSATQSQFLPKIIAVLLQPAKIAGMSYMEPTDANPSSRNVPALITLLDARYAKTDSERARSWLKEFTQFTRKPAENLKDFWPRFQRVNTRLETLPMKMSEEMIFSHALQALKLSETQLPIVISALETKQNSHSVETLKDITSKMFETHRHNLDSSEVYMGQATVPNNEESSLPPIDEEADDFDDDADYQQCYDEETGETYWIKPKRAAKARNAPGSAVSAQKGAVEQFSHVPNSTPNKGFGKASQGKLI